MLLVFMLMMTADITQFFLHGERYDEPRFVIPPKARFGSWSNSRTWWRIQSPLYGYRGSPARAQRKLFRRLSARGLRQATYDKCLWYMHEGGTSGRHL